LKIPFFDLKRQYASLRPELEPELLRVMESCGYIGGKTVQDFEGQFAAYLGARHAAACGNGTDALVLALRACGVQPGDEVITTPFTFFATAEAIAAVGAKPVFVDIRPEDFTIDPARIEDKITSRTRIILPVHLFGAPCEMADIMEIANKHGLHVVEDAAQAAGCIYHGKPVGAIGDIGCFSFYPTKNLGGMGDGGSTVTNNADTALILSALREHGAGKQGAKAYELLCRQEAPKAALPETGGGYDPYKYMNSLIGYNSRLDAIQAAALSIKLRHLEEYNAARTAIAAEYTKKLCDHVRKPSARPENRHCWHQYVIRTKHKAELCAFLNEKGVGVGTFYPIPLHLQKAFDYLGYQPGDFPEAEAAAAETVCLPIFPELSGEELAYVIEQVNSFFMTKAGTYQ